MTMQTQNGYLSGIHTKTEKVWLPDGLTICGVKSQGELYIVTLLFIQNISPFLIDWNPMHNSF